MTVERWLRGQVQGLGSEIERDVLEVAALSGAMAMPEPFRAVGLGDCVGDYLQDEQWMRGLRYALSTLYYSLSGAITGGSKIEKRGNRQLTIGGYPLTTKDREAFRALGDKIRKELGAEVETDERDEGGCFDATYMRHGHAKL